ncbi:unnamed protein product [Dicrocoelium dendriticum]|nr:unnamed protein product [Dicrocoelium dendriticum]CAH8621311.1 unnamed protein product [Dicrocoelium dendriticum]
MIEAPGTFMADAPQIGGAPARRLYAMDFSPLSVILLSTLVVSSILTAVGLSQNRISLATVPKTQLDVSLAFAALGLIFAVTSIVIQLFCSLTRFGRLILLHILLLTFVCLSVICFAVSTGVSYIGLQVYTGAWMLSATWIGVVSTCTAIFLFLMNRNTLTQ